MLIYSSLEICGDAGIIRIVPAANDIYIPLSGWLLYRYEVFFCHGSVAT